MKAFTVGLIWLGLISFAYGAVPEKIRTDLDSARENLRIGQATAERIAGKIEALKQSGQASPEVLHDYETYLARVEAMVEENRKVVRELEAAYAGQVPPENAARPEEVEEGEKLRSPPIPEEPAADDLATLDRQFAHSLSDFDEMLLKEMDAIQAQSSKKMFDLAEEAAEAVKRLREKGVELDLDESQGSFGGEEGAEDEQKAAEAPDSSEPGESQGQREKTGEPGSAATEEGKASEREKAAGDKEVVTGDRSKAKGGGEGPSGEREGRYDPQDDDIVARQLREAAEKETDPVLKEKLWKEYEEYKKNTR